MVEKRIFLSCKWLFSSQPGIYTRLPFSAHLKGVIFWLANKLVLWRRRWGFWFVLSSVQQCNAVCLRDDTCLCAVRRGAGVSSESVVFSCKTLLPSSTLPSSLHETVSPLPETAPSPKGYLQSRNFQTSSDATVARARTHWCQVYQCFRPLFRGPCLPVYCAAWPPLPSSFPVSTWLCLHGFWCWLCFQTCWTFLSHCYVEGEGDRWPFSLSVWCWEE